MSDKRQRGEIIVSVPVANEPLDPALRKKCAQAIINDLQKGNDSVIVQGVQRLVTGGDKL